MKKDERDKEEKLAGLLKDAEGHPMMKAIRAEKAAAVLGERLLAAGKLRAATEKAEKVIPERQREVDALVADLTEYDKGRSVILDKLTAARGELVKARQSLDWERSHAEAALLSNYDTTIDDAITFFRDRIESLMVKDINTQTRTGETNVFTEKKEVFVFSNYSAIRDTLAYCRSAIDEIERMKLTPDLDADKIEALRKGIPDADELSENAGEKDMASKETGPGYRNAILEATGNHLDYLSGKIKETAQKILTPKWAGR